MKNDSEFLIRAAQDDDSAALVGLLAEIFAEYEGCILDIDGEMPELRRPASYASATCSRWWVAEIDGHLVGSACACPSEEAGAVELKRLYVAASARRRGLGEHFVGLVEQEATRRAARTVFLWTDTRFRDAHRLYERMGYSRAPKTRALHDASSSIEYRYDKDLRR